MRGGSAGACEACGRRVFRTERWLPTTHNHRSQDAQARITHTKLIERLDLERLEISTRLAVDPRRRADLAQFFTPASVAQFVATMLRVPRKLKDLRLLDAGGESGILTATAVAEICARQPSAQPDALHATVWEIDDRLLKLRAIGPHGIVEACNMTIKNRYRINVSNRAARRRAMSTLLTARLPPTARPSRRFPGPLIWSSRSQTTAGTRRSVERGDRKKSCAEFLRTTHSLYLSDFRWVTPAIDLTSTEMRRAPGRPRPVFIDLFWHRGWPVPPVRAQRAQLRW